MKLDGFMIVYNEEHLLPYALAAWESLGPLLGTLSLVDNGSTDATAEIIQIWTKRLPIVWQVEEGHRHHGLLRNLALSRCSSPWILYIDADETFTSDMRAWLEGPEPETANQWEFYKYTTILDRYHYVEGGNGPTQRMFRNFPGVGFPQSIHTEPTHPSLGHIANANARGGPLMFDHTACKYPEELWAKGWRYQWAKGVEGIGPSHEYVGRVANAMDRAGEVIREFDESIKARIFTGP